jgi:hypothetical protein
MPRGRKWSFSQLLMLGTATRHPRGRGAALLLHCDCVRGGAAAAGGFKIENCPTAADTHSRPKRPLHATRDRKPHKALYLTHLHLTSTQGAIQVLTVYSTVFPYGTALHARSVPETSD